MKLTTFYGLKYRWAEIEKKKIRPLKLPKEV
jgi:hypothetical protein